MTPKRIQRKRTKGWRMPPNTVYVGRPTKWGNPFVVAHGPFTRTKEEARQAAVDQFSESTLPSLDVRPLKGKDLACWCPLDQPCHADVLLAAANR